jgi:hypothetical protein
MSLTAGTQSFLFLMGSLSDAAVLDAAIESQHLGFQKLGPLTYQGCLDGSPEDFCHRLSAGSGVDCEIHWMRLPYPSDQQPESVGQGTGEPFELEPPSYFLVNNY